MDGTLLYANEMSIGGFQGRLGATTRKMEAGLEFVIIQ